MSINLGLQKAINYLLIGFIIATVLPLKLSISSLFLAVASLISVIYFFTSPQKVRNKNLFVLTIPLLVYLVGFINSENIGYAFKMLERNLSLLLFPIIFFCIGRDDNFNKKAIVLSFLGSVIIVDFYLAYLYSYYFNFGEKFSVLLTHDIYHSTYLAMYNALAFVVLYFRRKYIHKTLFILLAVVFLFSIVACSSRMVFIVGFVSLLIFSVASIKKTWQRVAVVLLIPLLAVLLVLKFPSLSEKFEQIQELKKISFDNTNYQSLSSRLAKIEATVSLIIENPFLGTGTGDLIDDLVLKYKDMDFVMGYKYRYNPHNQFLDNLARNGLLLGGIALWALFFYPIFTAIKMRNMYLLFTVFVFASISLTESIFGHQRGITMFAFFLTFLLWENQLKSSNIEKE